MNANRSHRATLTLCVVLPVCAVVAARALFPALAPSAAMAVEYTAETPEVDSGPMPIASTQSPAAAAETTRLLTQPIGPSPLADRTPKTKPVVIEAEPEPVKTPPPEFTLTSVAGRGVRAFAMIDGKLRKVGDDLGEGWIVREIDTPGRSVRVAGPDEHVLVLTLRDE
jgi:hypothetical protein